MVEKAVPGLICDKTAGLPRFETSEVEVIITWDESDCTSCGIKIVVPSLFCADWRTVTALEAIGVNWTGLINCNKGPLLDPWFKIEEVRLRVGVTSVEKKHNI